MGLGHSSRRKERKPKSRTEDKWELTIISKEQMKNVDCFTFVSQMGEDKHDIKKIKNNMMF